MKKILHIYNMFISAFFLLVFFPSFLLVFLLVFLGFSRVARSRRNQETSVCKRGLGGGGGGGGGNTRSGGGGRPSQWTTQAERIICFWILKGGNMHTQSKKGGREKYLHAKVRASGPDRYRVGGVMGAGRGGGTGVGVGRYKYFSRERVHYGFFLLFCCWFFGKGGGANRVVCTNS